MTQLEMSVPAGDSRVVFDDLEIGEIAVDLDDQEPEDVIEWALDALGDRIAIVTALQADGMVVLDMAAQIRPDIQVVTVDTGRLPQETYAFIDEVRQRYPRAQWDVLFPDATELQAMVRQHGTDLFRRSVQQRLLCCHKRKVQPLTRALRGLDGWFTGLRRDQWASRAAIKKVEPTMITAASSRSTPWLTGPTTRCGNTSVTTTFPPIRYTPRDTPALAARHARARPVRRA